MEYNSCVSHVQWDSKAQVNFEVNSLQDRYLANAVDLSVVISGLGTALADCCNKVVLEWKIPSHYPADYANHTSRDEIFS